MKFTPETFYIAVSNIFEKGELSNGECISLLASSLLALLINSNFSPERTKSLFSELSKDYKTIYDDINKENK